MFNRKAIKRLEEKIEDLTIELEDQNDSLSAAWDIIRELLDHFKLEAVANDCECCGEEFINLEKK